VHAQARLRHASTYIRAQSLPSSPVATHLLKGDERRHAAKRYLNVRLVPLFRK
jgi:hypothetical protein